MNNNNKTTYTNPIMHWDVSDPDAIRVGSSWYLVASTFTSVPGLPVYRSENLVDWKIISYALPLLYPADHYSHPRPGCGVWAPAIRHFDGVFSIWYPDPDFGIFKVYANDPEGPWSKPELVDGTVGSIDPCPFIDDDGSRWLVKGWAKSRAGINNRLSLCHLDKNDHVSGAGVFIIEGEKLPPAETSRGLMPWITIEGPKLYKRNGWYYIFAPAGGVKQGWQGVFRAKNLTGPWEARNVMDQGKSTVNGPHQGAWVDAPDGKDWFIHFQDREAWGRIVHLQPLAWKDDWPVIGTDSGNGMRGEPATQYTLPVQGKKSVTDNGTAWQWSANPEPFWMERTPEATKLNCVPGPRNPWENGAVLSRPIKGPTYTLSARIVFNPLAVGEQAGLVVLGYHSAWIGLRSTDNGLSLIREDFPEAETSREKIDVTLITKVAPESVYLRVTFKDRTDTSGVNATFGNFEWSFDGVEWKQAGSPFKARPGRWVGTKAGFQAAAIQGTISSTAGQNGCAIIDQVRHD